MSAKARQKNLCSMAVLPRMMCFTVPSSSSLRIHSPVGATGSCTKRDPSFSLMTVILQAGCHITLHHSFEGRYTDRMFTVIFKKPIGCSNIHISDSSLRQSGFRKAGIWIFSTFVGLAKYGNHIGLKKRRSDGANNRFPKSGTEKSILVFRNRHAWRFSRSP